MHKDYTMRWIIYGLQIKFYICLDSGLTCSLHCFLNFSISKTVFGRKLTDSTSKTILFPTDQQNFHNLNMQQQRDLHTTHVSCSENANNRNNGNNDHESITTFSRLRKDVFSELSHHETVQRFILMNKITARMINCSIYNFTL